MCWRSACCPASANAFDLIRTHGPVRTYTLANMPKEDAEVTYDDAAARPIHCRHVFQVESRAQMNMLPRMRQTGSLL